jgi:hypothetical protein
MHKSATKCNETLDKWCKNKHGASKIMDTLETYQDADWKQSDEVETMVVTPRLFASCNGEAMRLGLMVQHGQDGYDDERWFWVMIALPGDAGDRGDRGGEVCELEEVRRSGNCSPELQPQPVRSRRGRVRCSRVQEEK